MLQPQRANCLSSSGRVRLLSQNASRSSQQLILQFKKQGEVPKMKPFLPVFGFEPMNNFELDNVQEVVLPLVVRSGVVNRQTVTNRIMKQENKIKILNESNQTDKKRQGSKLNEFKMDLLHKQRKQRGNEQQNNFQRIENEHKKDNKRQEECNKQELKIEELEMEGNKEQMEKQHLQNEIRINKEKQAEMIRNDHENNENLTEQEEQEHKYDQISPNKQKEHEQDDTGMNQPKNNKQTNKQNKTAENLTLSTHNEQPTEITEKVDQNENDVDFDKLLSFSHPLKITKTKPKDYAYKETVFDFAKERQSAKYLMGWQRVIRIGGIKIKDWERINGKKMMLLDAQTTQTK
ncbi:Hypothetical_protein [Hexamita inflata]|uniref:Hypothetical_protein n=1 Tax=Hexamita inflata TaxID=28002 RepID=A0AA86TUB8_9EUKA|nr:Hypothetical protein HINF_LOCUS16500 [Hexamita inflata]